MMAEKQTQFTIENFYKFVRERKLMAAQCNKCGKVILPPKPMCPQCFSKNLKWRELPKQGKLLTYTVIHISPKELAHLTPYPVGLVKLEEGAQLPGIIRNLPQSEIRIGMELAVDFDTEEISQEWPQWPRYYFKPMT